MQKKKAVKKTSKKSVAKKTTVTEVAVKRSTTTVRVFSLEKHGEDFVKLAEEFATKHGYDVAG